MKAIENFLLLYGTFMFSTVVLLSLVGLEALDTYVALFAVELFVASELTSPLGPTETRKRVAIDAVMLGIFIGIILKRALQVLGIAI